MGAPDLIGLGWSAVYAEQLSDVETHLQPMRIATVHRARMSAEAGGGPVRLMLPPQTNTSNYAVGDWVLIEGEGRVVFRYAEQVNGSARDIAGVVNAQGNVLGLMPHPERLIEAEQGGTDGRRMFEGLLAALG